jgi:hypothetical protein
MMIELQQAIAEYVEKQNIKSNDNFNDVAKNFISAHQKFAPTGKKMIAAQIRLAVKNRKNSESNFVNTPRIKAGTISAPYRFAVLENTVAMPEGQVDLSMPLAEGLCATIEVEWVAETPLLIGNGGNDAEPMQYPHPDKAEADRYVIPGSSLRGMIRSVTEALALGRMTQVNANGNRRNSQSARNEATVREVLETGHPAHSISTRAALENNAYNPDFVESLFGYVMEPDSIGLNKEDLKSNTQIARRGRVSFSTAWIVPGQHPEVSDAVKMVSMAPRASYAPFYLASADDSGKLDYNRQDIDSVKLAGRKRYLPRFQGNGNSQDRLNSIKFFCKEYLERLAEEKDGAVPSNICSNARFLYGLDRPLSFTSTIKLHNVTAAELGAVLFALTLGGHPTKPYRHMLGRGKPSGAGQIRVQQARLEVRYNRRSARPADAEGQEVLSSDGSLGYCPSPRDGQPSHSHKPFLNKFRDHMKKETEEDYPLIPSVVEFLNSCDPSTMMSIGAQRMGYMLLSDYIEFRKFYCANSDQAHTERTVTNVPKAIGGRLLPVPRRPIKTAFETS